MGNEQGRLAGEPTPAGIQSMDENLQRKFAKGIQYNMKIVIRGDRNTGKSCLFHRMEGKSFQEAYIPTNEIQVTSILWSYRVTNDTVKVEIWDVVDKGRTQKKSTRGGGILKMFNEPEDQEESDDKVLDAGFLDVYKGAHGVVFLYDITKQWTWQYIERELPKVPFHLPVIILGNFRDMGDHRVVSKEVCSYYIEHMDRPEGAADIRYAEGSMKNGFGLMHLHKFLSIPFLQLQQETLLQQLQVNREQTLAAREELDSSHRTEDQNYDLFEQKLDRIAEERGRRRTKSIEQEPGPGDESPTIPRRRDLVEADSRPAGEEATDYPHREQHVRQGQASSPDNQDRDRKGSFKTKLTSKLSGFLTRVKEESGKEAKPSATATPPMAPASRPRAKPTTKMEDFVPEGDVDGFFEDEDKDEEDTEEDEEDDSDEDTHKPQIAMDEDLSSPEEEEPPPPAPPTVSKPSPQVKRPPVVLKSAKDIELTESEEEDETSVIMADEDIGDEGTTPALLTSKKTKDVLSGELVPAVEKKKKKESKSSGLMLEFNLPSPSPPQPKKTAPPNEEKRESPKGTPDVGEKRRDSKSKKKSKKNRHNRDEPETTKTKSTAQQGGGGGRGRGGDGLTSQVAITSDDPFGPIAALDAWLNSDSTEPVGDLHVLQPSKVEVKEAAKPNSSLVEVGEEAEGEGEEESPETQHKKTRKHKHHHKRHHRGEKEGEGEGEGEGEEGTSSSSRKKHRHHHRSSRQGGSSSSSRPSVEAPGEYDEI